MRGRLIRGVGANAYAQGVTAAVQLCTVPVFLNAWGSDRFGLWLTLAAWASFLSLADGGLMVAAGNAMAMAAARGDRAQAARLFACAFRFILVVSGALAALVIVGCVGLAGGLGGSAPESCCVLAALTIAVLVRLPLGTLELAFRAEGDYATGTVATSSVRLAESLAAVGLAAMGHGLGAAALAIFGVRLLGTVSLHGLVQRRVGWGSTTVPSDAWSELRPLVRPALAALAVPVAFGLALQGSTIAAGCVLPAGAVALFVASRTLTRALVQALGLFTHALMPEASFAVGRGDVARSAALQRLNLTVALSLLGPGWVVLVVFGPNLMARWTGDLLRPDPVFFAVMATAALVHGAWLSSSNLLLAANRQAEYAYVFVVVAAATCVASAMLGHVAGLRGLACAGLAGELAMAAFVLPGEVRAALHSRMLPGRP